MEAAATVRRDQVCAVGAVGAVGGESGVPGELVVWLVSSVMAASIWSLAVGRL
jgi:hypothetical protein